MALEGTLRDFSLADIFQLIGLQRKTGVLTLRSKEDTVTVTFLDGKVVGADSLDRRLENRLGSVLIRTGYLTQDQLTRALEIQKETLQRLGFILTHYGIISADSLREAIQLQLTQIVYRLFRWHDGDYHFSQETTIEYDRDNVTPISAESILMEGARMIDEWPIIEKRIRSYDMIFRKKLTDQEIVVVGAEDADEVDFDGTSAKKRRGAFTETIRITQEEKSIYAMVDGTMTVGEIIEVSRLPEFDTTKALYELLTRDLIEEVRGASAAAVLQQATPVDELEVAETPVPLPLVLILVVLAIASLVTSVKNPLNGIRPLTGGPSAVDATRKAISLQRIEAIGQALEKYNDVQGRLPAELSELTPHFIGTALLIDPWGNPYKYLQPANRYLVIGFSAEGRPDTDLYLERVVGGPTPPGATKVETGGITLSSSRTEHAQAALRQSERHRRPGQRLAIRVHRHRAVAGKVKRASASHFHELALHVRARVRLGQSLEQLDARGLVHDAEVEQPVVDGGVGRDANAAAVLARVSHGGEHDALAARPAVRADLDGARPEARQHAKDRVEVDRRSSQKTDVAIGKVGHLGIEAQSGHAEVTKTVRHRHVDLAHGAVDHHIARGADLPRNAHHLRKVIAGTGGESAPACRWRDRTRGWPGSTCHRRHRPPRGHTRPASFPRKCAPDPRRRARFAIDPSPARAQILLHLANVPPRPTPSRRRVVDHFEMHDSVGAVYYHFGVFRTPRIARAPVTRDNLLHALLLSF